MIFSVSNLKKTWYYLQKNGVKAAWSAAIERIEQSRKKPYIYETVPEQELERQRKHVVSNLCISLVVPAYETKPEHLTALLDSLAAQTYQNWELVIADASQSSCVKEALDAWQKARAVNGSRTGSIRYLKLSENKGISENTNAGIEAAAGDYIGLLDHDDLLTPDALYEMVSAIEEGRAVGMRTGVLYSDEDKCDGSGSLFYEPHRKMDFNLDLLLSNNYICHFLVMESGLMKALKLRTEYDGAQDFDLVLRAASAGERFWHVPKVLYHWRCHNDSTAANPRSKAYAYEAGKRAVEDFCRSKGWKASVSHLKHLGFYRADYEGNLFESRKDIGAVAGPLPAGKNLNSGIYEKDGHMRYEGLRRGFSGPMHRAALTQDVNCADLRTLKVREEFRPLYEQALKRVKESKNESDLIRESQVLCEQIRNAGYLILWDPQRQER